MARDRKGNGSKDGNNSTGSGSQAEKFSEKNVDENQHKDADTQEPKEFVKDGADYERNKGIDTTEANTKEATPSTSKMDKDGILNVSKDNENTASVTPEATLSTVKVKKDGVKVGRKNDKATSNTPMVTRSTKKVKKDEVLNAFKDSRKATIDNKADEKSKSNATPAKKLFEQKTKESYKATNKAQILKSPASLDLKLPRSKATTGVQVLKSPANADLKPSRSKATTGVPVLKSLANSDLKSPRSKATSGVQVLKSTTSADSLGKSASKRTFTPPKAFFTSVSPIQPYEFRLPAQSLRAPKLNTYSGKQIIDSKETEPETEVTESNCPLQDPKLKDIEKIKQSDLDATDSKTKESISKPLLEVSQLKDIDEQKQLLDLSITDPKAEENVSKLLLQDPMISALDENLRNLDLNTSKMEQDPSIGDRGELNEFKNNESEKIVNLERNVNLSFEFDEHCNKTILVDEVKFDVDEKQKFTFIIEGKAQISFIGKKVSISTQGGQIDCSMQRNRVVFSLTDSPIKSDPLPEDKRTTEVQRNLQNTLNNFVSNFKTTCGSFEHDFLKSLK